MQFTPSPRESVILVDDFTAQVTWYQSALGFALVRLFEGDYHYANLETATGIRLGLAPAAEMGVSAGDRRQNTVLLQFEVADVPAFLAHIQQSGGQITFGPSLDKNDNFWFGGFTDPEGNPFWVVDPNCP